MVRTRQMIRTMPTNCPASVNRVSPSSSSLPFLFFFFFSVFLLRLLCFLLLFFFPFCLTARKTAFRYLRFCGTRASSPPMAWFFADCDVCRSRAQPSIIQDSGSGVSRIPTAARKKRIRRRKYAKYILFVRSTQRGAADSPSVDCLFNVALCGIIVYLLSVSCSLPLSLSVSFSSFLSYMRSFFVFLTLG